MRALTLVKNGEFERRRRKLYDLISPCRLCPRKCEIDRLNGEIGFCGVSRIKVASYGPHYGEESCLVGKGGSGTIFFSGCNLACIFCQNYSISHGCQGVPISSDDLAGMMIELQNRGCENINWVTPTHVVPFLIIALGMAIRNGLDLPIVYNCGGYESIEVLKLLDGIIDIYLPDIKFASQDAGEHLAQAPDYFDVACDALRIMNSQVDGLEIDEKGIAVKGVLVRHLVLPNGASGSARWADVLPSLIGKDGTVNIMNQYRPMYHATSIPSLDHGITLQEFREARDAFTNTGLTILC